MQRRIFSRCDYEATEREKERDVPFVEFVQYVAIGMTWVGNSVRSSGLYHSWRRLSFVVETYDVCVIGSGPAGGVLSKELAEAGAKVVLVEAGPSLRPGDFHYHAWPYQFANRIKPHPGYPNAVTRAIRYNDCDNIFVDRIRAVGGRSVHWNACCFRFASRDFRERSIEGVEEDWPLSYEELAPFYSHVEK